MVKRIKITNATDLTSNCIGKIRKLMLDFCLTIEEDAGVHKYLNWPLNAYHFQEGVRTGRKLLLRARPTEKKEVKVCNTINCD